MRSWLAGLVVTALLVGIGLELAHADCPLAWADEASRAGSVECCACCVPGEVARGRTPLPQPHLRTFGPTALSARLCAGVRPVPYRPPLPTLS
jgi:hypothetical protein